ncbi:hypothetical protein BHE74_00033759 [Ensete ventricosum]|nr:hypothetical protein BHE74_00033759 [Ensete ventricosum]
MYWFARCSISGIVVGGRSISDQKNLEGRSPTKNAWITKEGCASGTPRISAAKRPTNWPRDSSLPWVRLRSEVAVGLGWTLVKKFSSNSFASRSNDEIEDGLSRLYHIRAGPLRVVGKARHISAFEVPIKNAWITKEGCVSGTPRISAAKHLTNWPRDSLLPWVRPRSEAAVGLGRALAKKFNSNSFASKSNDEIEDGLSRLYHIRAGPLRVVGKAWHISASEVS